ncbi:MULTISPECIES: hypothetical protein [Clostridia]|uniref:hypothetical protein n=1 Tax=Clostridium sp. CCUG 7971 TaxID=2811414 RepID=UPI001ABAADA1|nr:hypothetical protein [Clostridium sp. CCUG 7971]MBO3444835.1 hypothetical protein [Clostridium sp. CCUG 7971]
MKDINLEDRCFKFTEKILYNYKHMESHIESLKSLKNDITAGDKVALRAITYDNIKVSPTYKISNAVMDGVIDPVKTIQEIDIDIYHENSLKKKIDRAINNLDIIRKEIIKLRYEEKKSWLEMSQDLYYDEKTLRKYKNEAIKSISIELFGSKVFKEEEPTLFDMLVI